MQHYFITLISIICCIWVSSSAASQSQTLTLPQFDSNYAVGTKSIEVIDKTRKSTRNSEERKWVISLFYPAADHNEKSPYLPGTITDGFIQGTQVLAHVKLNANPTETHKKFPVIIFIPGRGELRQKYTILCAHLASHGYVVITMDQPYVASFVKFANGETNVLTFKDAWNLPRDRDYRYAYDDLVIKNAISDIDYVLNHPGILGSFREICDFNKVVLMGHSLGGNVAHIMGFRDQRIRAVVDIDSKITERSVYGKIGIPDNKIGVPILFIRGMMQYQEDVGNSLHKIKNSTIWQPMVQHSAFSDNAYLAHYIKNFGTTGLLSSFWNWFFKKGPHFDPIDTSSGNLLSISGASIGYSADKIILKNISLAVGGKERIAISGKNASGKSTLLKAILGKDEIFKTGDWYLPRADHIGYLDQHYSNLKPDASVIQHIQELRPDWTEIEARRHLNDFLFRKNEEVMQIAANLSGGEKARLSLSIIAAKTPRLLILDEITNNLDLETKEHVIQVLKEYPGAMIIVSHEKDFLKAIDIDHAYTIVDGKLS